MRTPSRTSPAVNKLADIAARREPVEGAEKVRHAFQAKGKVLRSAKTGLTYVPVEDRGGSWRVVVVGDDDSGTYRVGDYDLIVFNDDIERDKEVTLG